MEVKNTCKYIQLRDLLPLRNIQLYREIKTLTQHSDVHALCNVAVWICEHHTVEPCAVAARLIYGQTVLSNQVLRTVHQLQAFKVPRRSHDWSVLRAARQSEWRPPLYDVL